MTRLVIVSNRVPLPSERGPRAGGLAVALADALRPGSLWFGWSGKRSATPDSEARLQRSEGITYATIDLSEAEYRSFYVGFANSALWPLLHFRLGLVEFKREDYEAYRAVNRRFAESLSRLLHDDDLIWVHDYHLFTLAEELRRLGVRNRIGFFLHTPFVPPALLHALPRAADLLRAMCAYDVVGFHTRTYRRAFLDCVREILPGTRIDRRQLHARRSACGVDRRSDRHRRRRLRGDRGARANTARDSSGCARAWRTGAGHRRRPARLFQGTGQPLRGVWTACSANIPSIGARSASCRSRARSREDSSSYQRLRRDLDRIVGDTNGRFSEFDWVPLRYMTEHGAAQTLAGFYRCARLGVVTPLRDGMNLVAKEYVAAQDPADPGVLILSRFAGAAEELTEALIVNPFDADEIADAMHEGLAMPLAERLRRHDALRERVWETTASKYCANFLAYLEHEEPTVPRLRLQVAS